MKKYLLMFTCTTLLMNCGDGLKFTLSKNDILESSSPGTSIGTLAVDTPPDGIFYTYKFVTNDAAFDIVGDKLVVADGTKLDFEDAKTHDINVKVTGSDGSHSEQKFIINVLDVVSEVTNLNNSGAGSLRKVVADATPGSTIGFKSTLMGTIALATPISIYKKLTILSPGSTIISVSGETLSDVFDITSVGNLTISGITIENASGAGISNEGILSIYSSVMKNNSGGYGGAISNVGTTVIRNCTFTGNDAYNGGALGNSSGDMFVYDSAIYGNSTTGNSGAGIVNGGNLTVVNTTISGNTVTGNNRVGGGIGCFGDIIAANLGLYNVTITGNTATEIGGQGGGVYAADCNLKIKNSLIAKNSAVAGGPDIFQSIGAVINSRGYNLIGKNTDNAFNDGEHHDQVGTGSSPLDPKLKALANNGGFTKTHAFSSSTSPAIDQIPPASCKDDKDHSLTLDQRGYARPANTKCDIGAFEAQ